MEDVGARFIASAPTPASPMHTPAQLPTPTKNQAAMVVCAYGWGKELRLYADYLLVDGRRYILQELLHVHCAYRTVLGVPSASLELHFKSQKLTLRGIAAIDDARRIVEYMTPWYTSPDAAFHRRDTRPVETALPGGSLREPRTDKEQSWRGPETEKRYAQAKTMPVIAVPLLLARGEGAHYSTPATLCGERIQETWRSTYPAQDHGLLILTNRRIIYVGRKSQLVLDYAHLLHVSRLRGAIALEAEHWQKRVIFAVPRPDECASCVETITRTLKQEPGRPQGSPLPYNETKPEARTG